MKRRTLIENYIHKLLLREFLSDEQLEELREKKDSLALKMLMKCEMAVIRGNVIGKMEDTTYGRCMKFKEAGTFFKTLTQNQVLDLVKQVQKRRHFFNTYQMNILIDFIKNNPNMFNNENRWFCGGRGLPYHY